MDAFLLEKMLGNPNATTHTQALLPPPSWRLRDASARGTLGGLGDGRATAPGRACDGRRDRAYSHTGRKRRPRSPAGFSGRGAVMAVSPICRGTVMAVSPIWMTASE